jgi:integrase
MRPDTVVVQGKGDEREVPLSPAVRDIVLAHVPWRWSSSQAAGLAVRRAFRRAAISGPRAGAHALRHTFVRQWNGDESVLIGIMGWTSSRMLKVYRPYNLERAISQHHAYSPLFKS